MKIITSSILLLLCLNVSSQDITKQLQSKTWYVTGRLYLKKNMVLASDSVSGYDWSAKFFPNGRLFMEETTRESEFDANGYEIGPGLHYIDSTNTYVLKKNCIKMDYSIPVGKDHRKRLTRISYYKISALSNKKDYELIPITEAEFKKPNQ